MLNFGLAMPTVVTPDSSELNTSCIDAYDSAATECRINRLSVYGQPIKQSIVDKLGIVAKYTLVVS